MYLEYFGLVERPFSIAPDPQYLYMSSRHKEAMAHLTYGLSQGGCFIVLTGEVGTGKTTLCRNLLDGLANNIEVALVLNASINEQELLQTVCDELKIAYQNDDSQKQLLDRINAHLLERFANNQQTVLIIDEAQLLSRDVLEQIRLLTNLETTKSKLLQIILIGQPELNDLLSRNDLRQLAQRVTARYHLGPLEESEIEAYVNFRLRVAGCRKPLFTKQALTQLYKSTDGIPRRINVLADHSLLSAYSKTSVVVDAKKVKSSSKDVFIQADSSSFSASKKAVLVSLLAVVLVLNLTLWWVFSGDTDKHSAIVSDIEFSGSDVSATGFAGSEPVPSEPVAIVETSSKGDASLEVADDDSGLTTTIVTSGAVTPGTVIISEEPLTEADLVDSVVVNQVTSGAADLGVTDSSLVAVAEQSLTQTLPVPDAIVIEQPPVRVFDYDSTSELGRVLEASADLTSRTAAFRALGAAWDVDLPARMIQPACSLLSAEGVKCLGVSTWAQLQRFNRPAILVLDQNGSVHRVIVFKLDEENAQILVGQSVLSVSVDELRSRWTNNGITFWRPSDVGSEFFKLGDKSVRLPKVKELTSQALQKLDLAPLSHIQANEFDQDFVDVISGLQLKYGLIADGRIGSETYLLINEILSPDQTPTLRFRVP